MTAHVISHRRARRKRATVWFWAARRVGALAVTLAALAIATWLAPRYRHAPAAAPPPPTVNEITEPHLGFKPPAALTAAKLAPTAPNAGRTRSAPATVPLNTAVPADRLDGFEVLSAAELAAISQARN